MPDSTLDLSGATPPVAGKGHGTSALGPSDTSDSGSDMQGPGIYERDAEILNLDTMAADDVAHAPGAGRDVGDANLDSDSDSGGTGERASAGRDTDVEAGSDIAPDRVLGTDEPVPQDFLDRLAIDDESENDDDEE
ncbi:MAG: hypothetical protein H0V63_11355 [Burkholderiaceae bacterium]|nr:hypothetical protein [Burkholderiaceae bacterium]